MTSMEARKHLGIKEDDVIKKDGIHYLLSIAESQIIVWSISQSMKVKLQKDIEAYKALLNEGSC